MTCVLLNVRERYTFEGIYHKTIHTIKLMLKHHDCLDLDTSYSLSPDDHSRVVLNVPDSNGNDYINASFINVSVHDVTYH